jgi:hypothetical protein
MHKIKRKFIRVSLLKKPMFFFVKTIFCNFFSINITYVQMLRFASKMIFFNIITYNIMFAVYFLSIYVKKKTLKSNTIDVNFNVKSRNTAHTHFENI